MLHKTRKWRNPLLVLAALVLLLAAVLRWIPRGERISESSASLLTAVPRKVELPPHGSDWAAMPRRQALEPNPLNSAIAVTGPIDDDTIPPALARTKTPFDLLRQRVMAASPDIAQFRHLQRKVLLKPDEKKMLRDLYKDLDLVEAAKKDLLAESETSFTAEGQFKRLYRVEYLGMSLEWKDNPERDEILRKVEQVVLAKNINAEQDLELRRSLAGDKVELFMILLHNDRSKAETLLQQTRGTDLGKLLAYAQIRFDALWSLSKGDGDENH